MNLSIDLPGEQAPQRTLTLSRLLHRREGTMLYGISGFEPIVGVVVGFIVVTGAAVYAARRVKIAVEMRRLSGERHDFAFNGQDARQKTESDSADREIPVEAVKIRDLTLSERDRYMADWLVVQSRFVDHPRGAVIEADELVSAILQVRGYPMAGFELHEADLSGNHLHLMECYGSANARAAVAGRDGAATEQLRTALIQFRAIFDELVKVVAPGIDELVQVEAAIAQEPAA